MPNPLISDTMLWPYKLGFTAGNIILLFTVAYIDIPYNMVFTLQLIFYLIYLVLSKNWHYFMSWMKSVFVEQVLGSFCG